MSKPANHRNEKSPTPHTTTPGKALDHSVSYEYWRDFDSLTIGNIAWMRHGIDPRAEEELPVDRSWDLSREIEVLRAAVHAGTIDVTGPIAHSRVAASIRVKRNARLFDWLRDKGWNDVANGLSGQLPSRSQHPPTPMAMPRQKAQELAILSELQRLGHNPVALPRAAPGKPGVKALVKKALCGSTGLFASTRVFDKAWERLQASGAIK